MQSCHDLTRQIPGSMLSVCRALSGKCTSEGFRATAQTLALAPCPIPTQRAHEKLETRTCTVILQTSPPRLMWVREPFVASHGLGVPGHGMALAVVACSPC